jgi:hypothetical protein
MEIGVLVVRDDKLDVGDDEVASSEVGNLNALSQSIHIWECQHGQTVAYANGCNERVLVSEYSTY